jgi:predicted RNA-binding Zn ribbon-like protein
LATPAFGYGGVVVEATGDLAVVEQFLNTLDERTFSWHGKKHVPSDQLTSVGALAGWLGERGLPAEGLETTDLDAAVALRAALRSALIDGDAEATQAFDGFPLRLSTEDGRLRITATSGRLALDTIVETVAANVAGGTWRRLKLCSSPDCRWAFYDTSRSGGGRWCFMEVCGNRNKTRAYRLRHAES